MLNNSYKKIVVDANGNKYESYKTIRCVHETPVSENSSNLQINNNKAIMTINSLELTGGETATTDDIVVTRSGKNLFNLESPNECAGDSFSLNSYTLKIDKEIIYSAGRYGSAAGTEVYIPVKRNTKYTISYIIDFDDTETTRVFRVTRFNDIVDRIYSDKVIALQPSGFLRGSLAYTINTLEYDYISLAWWSTTRYGMRITNLQIEEGDTATSYEPYLPPKSLTFSRDYLLSIKGVNNLLDTSKFFATQTKSGITWTNNGDGTITANGTAVEGSIFYNIGPLLSHSLLDGHKVLLRGCPKNETEYTFHLGLLNQSIYDYGNGAIGMIDGSRGLSWGVAWYGTPTFDNLVFKPELYDLTAIYGEGNEPTTVEQFLKTYPLSSTDKLTITKNSVKYNDTDITSEVTGLDEFMKTDTNTAIIDTNYTMGSISADVKKLFVSYKKSVYQADE